MAVTSPLSRLVFLALLRQPPGARISARAVAADSGVSRQVVNDVLRFLEFHNAIEPRPSNRVSWPKVADLAADLRLPQIVPARTLRARADLASVTEALAAAQVPHAVAFTTAANHWAFFEPDPDLHVAVAKDRVGEGAAVLESVEPADAPAFRRIRLYADDVETLETTTVGGIVLTTRLQTWLDLRHFPHAGAHAAFFETLVRGDLAGDLAR